MDAHEEYVWPRATSELILLPVTGLECVGERLLAGEGRLEARTGRDEAERSRGRGHGTKGCPGEDGQRRPEVAGMRPAAGAQETKKPGVASEALPKLQLMWKGREGPRKVQGHAVLLEGGGREVWSPLDEAGGGLASSKEMGWRGRR